MSLPSSLLGLESPALDADRDPPNLRRYPSAVQTDPHVDNFKRQVARDEALRERLRHERQDELARERMRREPRENYLAREYGVRRWGEL